MTMNLETTIIAGWYADPAGSGQLRWWDGATWTTHLAPSQTMPATVVDGVLGAPQVDGGLSRRELRERATADALRDGAVVESESESDSPVEANLTLATPYAEQSSAYTGHRAPVDHSAPWAADPDVQRSSTTAASWCIALLAVAQVVVAVLVIGVIGDWSFGFARWVLFLGPIAASFALVRRDRAILADRGFTHLPPMILAVFPLFYLITRWKAVGTGAALLFSYMGVQVILGILLALIVPSSGLLDYGTMSTGGTTGTPPVQTVVTPLTSDERAWMLTVDGMQQSLEAAIVGNTGGTAGTVCPPLPSTDNGASVTCTSTDGASPISITVIVTNADPLNAFSVASVLYD